MRRGWSNFQFPCRSIGCPGIFSASPIDLIYVTLNRSITKLHNYTRGARYTSRAMLCDTQNCARARDDQSERSGLVCLRVALARRSECIANKIALRQPWANTPGRRLAEFRRIRPIRFRTIGCPAMERGTKMQEGKRACLKILSIY